MFLRQLRRALLLSLLPISANVAHADDALNVNLLVFAQPEHSVSFELWRPAADLRLAYPAALIDLQGLQAPRDQRYADLGLSTSARMDRAAQRLQAAEYRVLLQKSWSQPVPVSNEAPAILIRGGQAIGEHHELEGYLTIYHQDNRIRLGTHLWLSSQAQEGSTQTSTAVLPEATSADASISTDAPGLPVANVVTLNDTRILNEGELHYVDHPRFGVLIEIGGDSSQDTSASEPRSDAAASASNDDQDTEQ